MIEQLEKALEENTVELMKTTSSIRLVELLAVREIIMRDIIAYYRKKVA